MFVHTKPVYSVKETANLICVSLATCYDLIQRGVIKSQRHPGMTRIVVPATAIDEFLGFNKKVKHAKTA